MPNNNFKLVWNFVIIALLAYSATYMPYNICFIQSSPSIYYQAFEYLVDCLFFTDILVNFISAIEVAEGIVDPRLKSIAITYLKSWFLLDLLATFPTEFLDNSASTTTPTYTS